MIRADNKDLLWSPDKLKQVVEKTLLNRIKNIGDDEHTYYHYPSLLIDEIALAINNYLRSNKLY